MKITFLVKNSNVYLIVCSSLVWNFNDEVIQSSVSNSDIGAAVVSAVHHVVRLFLQRNGFFKKKK